MQDNYVAQWGDPDGEDKAKAKPLPPGLAKLPESEYLNRIGPDDTPYFSVTGQQKDAGRELLEKFQSIFADGHKADPLSDTELDEALLASARGDAYAFDTGALGGWPIARSLKAFWPIHCYATVGVGRNLSPDTGSGAELYAVIGTSPRQLDRNIAVVGRVIEGIEHLSSLPRGTGDMGFYAKASERVPIVSVRLGSEVPGLPRYEYLATDSASFARYAMVRANRHDTFYIRPAGGVDICNVPVPVRRTPG